MPESNYVEIRASPAVDTRALHMVSAFLVQKRLTLALEPVRPRATRSWPSTYATVWSREAVATIDADSCQRTIVPPLQAAGTDHVLAVKHNQGLHAEVRGPCRRRAGHLHAGGAGPLRDR